MKDVIFAHARDDRESSSLSWVLSLFCGSCEIEKPDLHPADYEIWAVAEPWAAKRITVVGGTMDEICADVPCALSSPHGKSVLACVLKVVVRTVHWMKDIDLMPSIYFIRPEDEGIIISVIPVAGDPSVARETTKYIPLRVFNYH